MPKQTTKLSKEPSIRVVNGKEVFFYPLTQVESIIPPDERLPKQAFVTWGQSHAIGNSMTGRHECL